MATTQANQPKLPFPTDGRWGGRREGAGRPPLPKHQRRGDTHQARAEHQKRHPVHITVRLRRGLRGLRAKRTHAVIQRCFELGCERQGFRLVHYSVQSSHLHMICEADDRQSLSRGLQGLLIRIAKALNKLWRRHGSVFAGRYHERVMRTPRQVRNTIAYVLNNLWRHLGRFVDKQALTNLDPMASGFWFDGWASQPAVEVSTTDPPVSPAETWLLTTGWRKGGAIRFEEVPKGQW